MQRRGAARPGDAVVRPLLHARRVRRVHGPHPQQLERAGFGAGAGREPQPQPDPPVALTSASRAQQAPVPSGAAPPQQPAAAGLVVSVVVVRDVVFDMLASPQREAAFIAALTAEDAGAGDRTQDPALLAPASAAISRAASRLFPSGGPP